MTANQIAEIVREYLATNNNELTTSEGGDIDLCLDAINGAKRFAQLKRDWNFLKVHNYSITVPTTGLDITLSANGGFKKLTKIYLANADGTKGEPVDFTRERQVNDTFRDVDFDKTQVYQVAKKIYVAGATTDTDLVVEGISWLVDYDDSTQEDFFTDYGQDFLKFYAINQLQTYKKEDQRAYITERRVQKHFENLEDFDGELDIEEDSVMLD